MNNSAKHSYARTPISHALRIALGLGSLALVSACGGGGGSGASAPVELGAALPESGDFIAIEQSSLSLSESARTGSIQIVRLGAGKGASSVSYRFIAGSADASSDFRGVDGTVNWADGDTSSKTVSFLVASDIDSEGDEDFRIQISDVTGQEALGINDSVSVTVQDAACSGVVPLAVIKDTLLSAPCYRLTSEANVGSSAQLAVKAGTTIIADAGTGIALGNQSSLNMEGTPALPVFVKGADSQAGSWSGFKLQSSSALNRVQHVEISNAVNAFEMTSGGFAVLDNNVFTDNSGAGIKLPLESAEALGMGNQFSTTKRGIELVGNTIAENQTIRLPKQSTHYVLKDGLINNGTLELAAGTHLRMAADVQILVFSTGAINAVGTQEQPITIEGLEARPGYWNGIQYISSTSANNRYEHVVLAHGGGDPARAGNIIVDGLDTRITMQHCELNLSAGYGLVYDSNAFQVELTDVTFDQNRLGDQSL